MLFIDSLKNQPAHLKNMRVSLKGKLPSVEVLRALSGLERLVEEREGFDFQIELDDEDENADRFADILEQAAGLNTVNLKMPSYLSKLLNSLPAIGRLQGLRNLSIITGPSQTNAFLGEPLIDAVGAMLIKNSKLSKFCFDYSGFARQPPIPKRLRKQCS